MDLICFDLDNTLVDSERAIANAYNYAFEKNGFKRRKFSEIVELIGRPNNEVIMILTEIKNNKLIEKIYDDHNKALRKYFYNSAQAIYGVKKSLRYLKKKYKIGIVSNTSHKNILYLLKGAKLDRAYFDVIIGSDEVKHSKPYPDEIFKAERLSHRKAKCIIGDSVYDIMAGKRAKIKTIGVLSGRYTRKELKMHKADYVIANIAELAKIL